MKSGGCIGNVVIDGKLINSQDDGAHSWPNFAILNNGNYLMGYMTNSEIEKALKSNTIFTMVSGLTWLLRFFFF